MNRAISHSYKNPYSLHWFGIALNAYAKTWSHQGFAGIIHEVNEVEAPREINERAEISWSDKIMSELRVGLNDILDDVTPPIGHARASILPDLPYITWQYKDGTGIIHRRCNWEIFLDAVTNIYNVMIGYLKAINPGQTIYPLDENNRNKIQ